MLFLVTTVNYADRATLSIAGPALSKESRAIASVSLKEARGMRGRSQAVDTEPSTAFDVRSAAANRRVAIDIGRRQDQCIERRCLILQHIPGQPGKGTSASVGTQDNASRS
jgi:hypothetical protein